MSDETRRRLLAVARRVRAQGPLHPLIVVEGADEPATFVDADPFWGGHSRRKAVMKSLGGTLGYGVDAQRIYVVVEMWIAKESFQGTDEDIAEMVRKVRDGEVVPPSERPDRQSAIQVMELTRDAPEGTIMQTFLRRKGKLRWAEPKAWDGRGRFEDFTFGAFWDGLRQTEALRAAVDPVAKGIGMNDNQGTETFRRAARRAAVANFGAQLFEEHEIGRVLRKWRKR